MLQNSAISSKSGVKIFLEKNPVNVEFTGFCINMHSSIVELAGVTVLIP